MYPSRGIWWPRAVLCYIIFTFSRMQLRMQWTGRCTPPGTCIWWPRAVLHKVTFTDTSHIAIRNLTCSNFTNLYRLICVLVLPRKHLYHTRPTEQTTPQKHISWINNRHVTQITYAALYKHLELLFRDSLQLCIYMTSSHILAPNVWKCYQEYFQSRPIHSYPSMSSLVYYYTKVVLSRNYFHWSFIEKTSVDTIENALERQMSPSTVIWWPWAVLCNIILTLSRMQWTGRCPPSTAICWSIAILCNIILTFSRMQWTGRCRAVLCQVSLTFTFMHQVGFIFEDADLYPQLQASDGQDHYLTFTFMHQVSLTFCRCRSTPLTTGIWWSRSVLHQLDILQNAI